MSGLSEHQVIACAGSSGYRIAARRWGTGLRGIPMSSVTEFSHSHRDYRIG